MAASRPVRPLTPTWPVDERAHRGAVLRWPADYGWAAARTWADPVRDGLARHLTFERAELPQPFAGIVRFRYGAHDVALDYHDHARIDEACAAEVALYFKMQYRRGGYGLEHVVPGGYVPSRARMYRMLAYMRDRRDGREFEHDVFGSFSLV